MRTLATGTGRQKAKVLLDMTEAATQVADEQAATTVAAMIADEQAATTVAAMIADCDTHWRAPRTVSARPDRPQPLPEDIMSKTDCELLTVDEARALIASTALALADTVDCPELAATATSST